MLRLKFDQVGSGCRKVLFYKWTYFTRAKHTNSIKIAVLL